LDLALNSAGAFKLDIDDNQVAISWWVSAEFKAKSKSLKLYVFKVLQSKG
jgi:hypothetical protein